MRIRFRSIFGILGLLLSVVPLSTAGETKSTPAFLIRMKAIQEQLADAAFIARLANSEEQFKPFQDMYQGKLKGNSLDGIDVTRPLGAYATLESEVADTKLVLLLPIADQKAFLATLKGHDLAIEQAKDGLFTVRLPNAAQNAMVWDLSVREVIKAIIKVDVGAMPDPFYVRFADKYAHIGVGAQSKDLLDAKKMLPVARVLPAGVATSLSVSLAIDGLPADRKKQVLALVDAAVAKLKEEKRPDETAATFRLRTEFGAELASWVKMVASEAGELTLSFEVDRKKNDLALALALDGRPATKLARAIADLGGAASIGTGLVSKNSAMAMSMHAAIPQNLRKAWQQYVDEDLQKELLKDVKDNRALQEALYKVLKPTLLGAELDVGMDVRGPSKKGLYAAVIAVKVQDGPEVMKTILANLPEKEAKKIERDFTKLGNISIHKINDVSPDRKEGNKDQLRFGDGPAYFAARNDALMMAFGDGALDALKDALASKPGLSKLYHMEVSMSRFPSMFGNDSKEAQQALKKAFGKNPDADRIRMSLEGGRSLRVSYSMSGALITFFQMMNELKKGS